jgi:branched-subunit amino acid transport protein
VEKLVIFFGMALVTYVTRCLMIAALGRDMLILSESEGPSLLQRWLRYVPAAVLAALITPAALVSQGHLETGARTWATLAGAAIAWRTRSALLTILGGLATFWFFRLLGI